MRRILIADDNTEHLELMTAILKHSGFDDIVTASNGREAIEKLKAHQPDLAILDVMMPEASGYSVCRFIRQEPTLKKMKVLIFSALDGPSDAALTLREGGDLFFSKPFTASRFLQTVQTLLTQPSLNYN